ncbi:MAG: tRNA pseudouridine32 synthase/23S rRNA pseudouridine746 synthase [Oleiphilaceae bacterium]|jgi:tRNA pseudouridine32 synthase/23S rRNA pseudouridine746 synthase
MDDFVYDPPQTPCIKIIYQDDDVLVLDKPTGLLSVAGRLEIHKDSLQTRVQRVYPTASVVHRLDMSTSGIMLMALNKESHRNISRQFQDRQVSKRYLARIYGRPSTETGLVDLPLIGDWLNRPKQKVDFEVGKPSLTNWKILSSDGQSSLIELEPVTGRSHQLRVHMQSIGHPILGDKFYAHEDAFKLSERLDLHAAYIKFTHPTTHEEIDFSIDIQFV